MCRTSHLHTPCSHPVLTPAARASTPACRWLGFEKNAARFAAIVTEMGVLPYIRGFSTNVANYQPLGASAEHMCPASAFAETGIHYENDGPDVYGGVSRWCMHETTWKSVGGGAAAAPKCCQYDPCKLLDLSSGGATEMA